MSDVLEQPGDDTAPADFDLDAWIDGSKPTERSVTLVGRGDLVAEAEDVLRRYEVAKQIPAGDRGINDDSPDALLSRLEQLHDEMESTRSTWYLHALLPEEIDAARKAADKAAEKAAKKSGDPSAEPRPDYTAHMLAASVSRVVNADGRVAHGVTAAQIIRLRDRIGHTQVLRLVETMNLAISEEPAIHAPFSQTSSPDPDGGPS